MRNNFESDIKYMPYKEFVKKKGIRLCKKRNNKLKEQKWIQIVVTWTKKKRRRENTKQWFNRQSPEKQAELRQKTREYHKKRYHNLMVAVK